MKMQRLVAQFSRFGPFSSELPAFPINSVLLNIFLAFLFTQFATCLLLHPPIRVTPQPPPSSPDYHGPYAVPEPADGFPFIGIGEDRSEPAVDPVPRPKKRAYRSCTFKYIPHSCNQSELCESQRLCVQITGDPCCAPNEGECPTPAQLGVTCLKTKPVNWCHHSQDCARSALCCDTGCGYNMCVERQQI